MPAFLSVSTSTSGQPSVFRHPNLISFAHQAIEFFIMADFEKYELAIAFRITQAQVPAPDVTLTLGDYKWKVHSQLLTSNSLFFKKALEGSFQVFSSYKSR